MSASALEQHFLPLLKRLAGGDGSHPAPRLAPSSQRLTPRFAVDSGCHAQMFGALVADDRPWSAELLPRRLESVRPRQPTDRELTLLAIRKVGGVPAEPVPDPHFGGHSAVQRLATDDQDSVRLLTIPDLIALASNLQPAEVKQHLLDSIRSAVADKSWRVSYMVANEFVGLAEASGEAIVKDELVGAYVALLKDNEAEVRTAAASQIQVSRGICAAEPSGFHSVRPLADMPGFAKLLDREVILSRIIPCVKDCTSDSSQHVRAALATQISGLAPLLGEEATSEHLLPLFLQLLKDDFSEVRLNLIGKARDGQPGYVTHDSFFETGLTA